MVGGGFEEVYYWRIEAEGLELGDFSLLYFEECWVVSDEKDETHH